MHAPLDPRWPLGNDMSLLTFTTYVKGIFFRGGGGGGGGAGGGKHLNTSFIFPMTNATILGLFRTHVQTEYSKVLEREEHSYPKHFSILLFLKLATHLLKIWHKTAPSITIRGEVSRIGKI